MASLPSLWPQSDPPKPQKLLFVRISKSVDEVFGILWLSSSVSVALHTKRNDTNFLESPWFSSKQDLPEPAYAWEAGPADAQQKPASSALRFRRARFESAPSALASKPFQNDETQQLTTIIPGKRYVIEAFNTTTAPYGDKFKVWLRHIIVPSGPNSTLMLIEFGAEFYPSMNRLMKPVIGKAIEGGVKGTFKIFRQCLAEVVELEDAKDDDASLEASLRSDVLPSDTHVAAPVVPSNKVPVPATVLAPPVQAYPQPTPPRAPSQGGVMNGIFSFASDQLISHDQVSQLSELIGTSIRSMHQINVIARIAALLLTLSLLHLTVGFMRSMRSACSGGSRFLALLCWPLYIIDLPDSTTEVLSSLALVGAINLLVIRATKAGMAYMMYYTQRVSPGSLGSAYQAAAGSVGGVQHSASQVSTAVDLSAARGSVGVAATSPRKGGVGGEQPESAEHGAVTEVKGSTGMQGGSFPKARRAAPPARPHAFPPPPPLVRNPISPITVEMANIASKRKQAAPPPAAAATAATASLSAAAASPAGSPIPAICTSPMAGGVVSPAVPVKVTAAKPQSPKEPRASLPSSPPTATTQTAAAAAAAPSAASAAAASVAATVPAAAKAASTSAAPKAATAAAAAPSGAAATATTAVTAAAAAAATTPAAAAPTAAAPGGLARVRLPGSSSSINLSTHNSSTSSEAIGNADAGKAGAAAAAALAAGFKKDVFTNLFTKEGLDSMAETWKTGFGGLFNPKGSGEHDIGMRAASPPNLHHPPAANMEMSFKHSAAAAQTADVSSTSTSTTTVPAIPTRTSPPTRRSPGATVSAGGALHPASPRSPSPEPLPSTSSPASLAHPAPPNERHATRLSNTTVPSQSVSLPPQQQQQQQLYQALQRPPHGLHHIMPDHHQVAHSTQSMSVPHTQYPSLVTKSVAQWNDAHAHPVDDVEDTRVVVEEEVFENERFQPFRGWGSLWPGHFLPSDKIGRFGDRQGKPGGADSMQFERIAPLLPPGWKWVEENWEIDMDGYDMEAVDAEGWTYALDFSFLVHPPIMRTGKCSVKDFVRRRRLFRTRVRALPLHDTGEEPPPHDWEHTVPESCASSEADGTYAEGVVTEEDALSNSILDPRRISVSGHFISDDHFTTASSPAHSAPPSPAKAPVTVTAAVDNHVLASESAMTSNSTQELAAQSLAKHLAPQSMTPSITSSGNRGGPDALVLYDVPAWDLIPMVSPGEEEGNGANSLFSRKHPKPALPRSLPYTKSHANPAQAPNPLAVLPAAVGTLARTMLPTLAAAVKSVVACKLEPRDEEEDEQAQQPSRHSPVQPSQNPSAINEGGAGGWLAQSAAATAALNWQFDRDVAPQPALSAANPTSPGNPALPLAVSSFHTHAAPTTSEPASVVQAVAVVSPSPYLQPARHFAPPAVVDVALSTISPPQVLSPDSAVRHRLRDPLGALGMESDDDEADARETASSRLTFNAQQHPSFQAARQSESDNDSIGSFHGASTSNSVSWPSPLASRNRQTRLSLGGERLSLEQPSSAAAGLYGGDGSLAAVACRSRGEGLDHESDAACTPSTDNSPAAALLVPPHVTTASGLDRIADTAVNCNPTADSASELPASASPAAVTSATHTATKPPLCALAQEVAGQIADASNNGLLTNNSTTHNHAAAAGALYSGEFSPSRPGSSSGVSPAHVTDPGRFRQFASGAPRMSGGMSGDDLLLSATRKLQLGIVAPPPALPSTNNPVQAVMTDSSAGLSSNTSTQDRHQDANMSGSSSSTWTSSLAPEVQSRTRTPLSASAINPSLLRPPPAYSPLAPPEAPASHGM